MTARACRICLYILVYLFSSYFTHIFYVKASYIHENISKWKNHDFLCVHRAHEASNVNFVLFVLILAPKWPLEHVESAYFYFISIFFLFYPHFPCEGLVHSRKYLNMVKSRFFVCASRPWGQLSRFRLVWPSFFTKMTAKAYRICLFSFYIYYFHIKPTLFTGRRRVWGWYRATRSTMRTARCTLKKSWFDHIEIFSRMYEAFT